MATIPQEMGQLTLPEGRLYGVIYESILYGINVILLLTMLCIFAQQKKLSQIQRTGVAVICAIFLLCTLHLVAAIESIQLGFFHRKSAVKFFNDRSQAVILIQNVAYVIALMLADSLMIHRLYIIYNRDWRIAVAPGILLVATILASSSLIRAYASSPPESTLWTPAIAKIAPACFTLSFSTNLLITLLVIARLLRAIRSVQHLLPEDKDTFERRFLACTVESGLLYPASIFVTGVLYFVRSNALEILSGANIQLLCIVPMMLTLQMRLNLSIYEAGRGLRNLPSSLSMVDAPLQFHRMSGTEGGLTSFSSTLQPLDEEVPVVFPPTRRAFVMAPIKQYDTKRLSPAWSSGTPLDPAIPPKQMHKSYSEGSSSGKS